MTPLYFLLAIVLLAVSALAQTSVLLLLFWLFLISPVFAIAGIIGGILSRNRRRLGGILLLVSGVLPLILVLAGIGALAGATNKPASLPGGIILFAFYFWCFILILAGAISLRSRQLVRPTSP